MRDVRKEVDGLGVLEIPADKRRDAQTQRLLELTVRPALEK
jgi:fumarate hydratase class II